MATDYKTTIPVEGTQLTNWPAISGDEVGDEEDFGEFPSKSAQVAGTFGGATVTFDISNDGINFADSGAAGLTADGLVGIDPHARFIRPRVSGGTGTSLSVTIFGNKS